MQHRHSQVSMTFKGEGPELPVKELSWVTYTEDFQLKEGQHTCVLLAARIEGDHNALPLRVSCAAAVAFQLHHNDTWHLQQHRTE